MEYIRDAGLNVFAKKALISSVVRLDVEKPITYPDYVTAFGVEQSVSYSKINKSENRINHRFSLFEMSGGSGFFISECLIVTNFHVAIGAYSIFAKLAGSERELAVEGVEAFDIRNDLVVLKVAGEGMPLSLGDSNTVGDADSIWAVGYPEGVAKINHGTVNGSQCCCNQIKMNIDTSAGSSGCPVLNSDGEVIGVDVSGDELYSYAIPSNELRRLIELERMPLSLKSWHNDPYVRAYIETREGDMKKEIGLYEEAVFHYNIAIDLDPHFCRAYRSRAEAKFGIRAFDEGFADILSVLKLNPVSFSFSRLGAFVIWKRRVFQTTVARFFAGLYMKVVG
ncbi:trypsin-like peptidase domain-containing protein [Candidatus Poribacteria bacterium]|nr:trypsin-like peptidase domain-containing protein [Candidatus Poribacteria bacterium]